MTDSQPKDKRLSEISSHYDIGEKGFLNDEEKQVRAMDINGKGAVSADFAVKLATENSNFLRQIQKLNTRQLIMYAIVFTCCVATITSSIVGAERAKDTMINDQGDFVSKFNGAPVATSEALQDIGSIGFTEMTNDKLADLKYISFGENTVHLAVKGHLRNKDSSVTLLIEGGTLTFDNEELISSTGETGALLETALGYSLIENAGERRLASGRSDNVLSYNYWTEDFGNYGTVDFGNDGAVDLDVDLLDYYGGVDVDDVYVDGGVDVDVDVDKT